MVPRYALDPELTDRGHRSCISCWLIDVQFGPGGKQPGRCAANRDSTKGPGEIKERIPFPSKPYSSCWLLSCCPGSRQACRSWGQGGEAPGMAHMAQERGVQHAGLLWLACESRTGEQRCEAPV